ncbi:unnamed protein product [Cylicocyclus nassatus]|uniref:Uncharacterized protein n=1 Tax=Cylicocyclus nassatus TaxID=53992 RepID=A0AA36DQA2_CYLNA|nr:unnamed protein product [Cylicocyclus nassatus]
MNTLLFLFLCATIFTICNCRRVKRNTQQPALKEGGEKKYSKTCYSIHFPANDTYDVVLYRTMLGNEANQVVAGSVTKLIDVLEKKKCGDDVKGNYYVEGNFNDVNATFTITECNKVGSNLTEARCQPVSNVPEQNKP